MIGTRVTPEIVLPKETITEEPTMAQMMIRRKVNSKEVEEVAESLSFIGLIPKPPSGRKKGECSSKAKLKPKQRQWTRQKNGRPSPVLGELSKQMEMGKRHLFDVDDTQSLKEIREGAYNKQGSGHGS